MEPIDLAAKRAEHRQRTRDESPHVLVALPADGGLARATADVEEVLLAVELAVRCDDEPLPAPLAEREAADAVGRLASFVASNARAVEEDRPLVQPIAPDGQFELVPLCIASPAETTGPASSGPSSSWWPHGLGAPRSTRP